jgi:hypothetical protein
LRRLFCLGSVTQHAIRQVIHWPLIDFDQSRERGLIATPGLFQPVQFLRVQV